MVWLSHSNHIFMWVRAEVLSAQSQDDIPRKGTSCHGMALIPEIKTDGWHLARIKETLSWVSEPARWVIPHYNIACSLDLAHVIWAVNFFLLIHFFLKHLIFLRHRIVQSSGFYRELTDVCTHTHPFTGILSASSLKSYTYDINLEVSWPVSLPQNCMTLDWIHSPIYLSC